jgi:triphosphoribosyl-dephospho-CoA synthetase
MTIHPDVPTAARMAPGQPNMTLPQAPIRRPIVPFATRDAAGSIAASTPTQPLDRPTFYRLVSAFCVGLVAVSLVIVMVH